MAKNNNLTDFLRDIADTLRRKKGIKALINPQDFSSKIDSFKLAENDVNFYDYDGTLLYAYTWEEAQALTEMPELPTQEGLICQGWNYTLAEMQSQSLQRCNVGANYITDDGKTRLYIKLTADELTITVNFTTQANNAIIDWGDGSETESAIGLTTISHTYSTTGKYVISIDIVANYTNFTIQSIKVGTSYVAYPYAILKKVEIGKNIRVLDNSSFIYCRSLKSITIPDSVILNDCSFYGCYSLKFVALSPMTTVTGTFHSCYSLKSVSIPNSVKQIRSTFHSCYSLESIVIPDSVTSIGNSAFNICYSLKSITIPDSVTSIGTFAFAGCWSLVAVDIPSTIEILNSYVFQKCKALKSIVIPKSITTVKDYAFDGCTAMRLYDFSSHEAVPTLSAKSAFNGINADCKIVVPDELYDDWIAATNWSTYTSYIVKASEYNA